jgi:hypothetical protein
VTHWWQALMAVPYEKESSAYQRLARVWFDHTRFRGASQAKSAPKEYEAIRHHEFHKPDHETHLTVSFWENFTLFPAEVWLPRLYEMARLPFSVSQNLKCQWSYEWVGYRPKPVDGTEREEGMCDVVVSHEGSTGESGVLVVEAKNLTTEPGAKDLRLDYYLAIQEIAEFGARAALLYLVDEAVREKSARLLGELPSNVGLVTWQQLAGLQIELAQSLEAPAAIRNYVAGAIQFQFAQHDIRPAMLSASYLEAEMSMLEMDALPPERKQKMSDHSAALWRL